MESKLHGLHVLIIILQAYIGFNQCTIFIQKVHSTPDLSFPMMKVVQKTLLQTLPACFTFAGSALGLASTVVKYIPHNSAMGQNWKKDLGI